MRMFLFSLLFWFTLAEALVAIPPQLQQVVLNENGYSPLKTKQIINRNDFKSWLEIQPELSIYHILNNIGGSGYNNELPNGVVIASNSKEAPNYYYLWVRDSALTINSLVTYLNDVEYNNKSIAMAVEYYINNNYVLQRLSNPSGTFENGGLGEPKFHVNNTAFIDNWGRPQNDGPALRAITIINYVNLVNKYNNGKLLIAASHDSHFNSSADIYWNIIKPDLEYVCTHWDADGFDLWEEIKGKHFFTSLVQLKALKKGSLVAKLYDDHIFAKHLRKVAVKILHFIDFESHFINDKLHRINENPIANHKAGLDIATVIASLITHAASNDIDDNQGFELPYDVDDSYILNSLHGFIKDQKKRYIINQDDHHGISLGRYPNDVYDGVGVSLGNPWFLSNAYAATYFYKKIYKLATKETDLVIFKETYDFYNEFIYHLNQIDENYTNQQFLVVPYQSDNFKKIVSRLFSFGDSFLKLILYHITSEGELSEQFHRTTGYSQGATNLTWSYSSVWQAIRERTLVTKLPVDLNV